jgi:hypothetical protein
MSMPLALRGKWPENRDPVGIVIGQRDRRLGGARFFRAGSHHAPQIIFYAEAVTWWHGTG